MNSPPSPITKIFYLAMAALTLLAAAVQWMPDEGFPPDIELGAGQARAQAPLSAVVPAGIVPAPPPTQPYPATPYVQQPVVLSPAAQQPVPVGAPSPDVSPAPWMQPITQPDGTIVPPPQSTAILVPEPLPQELTTTRVLATVNGDVVLAGEVLASVNGYLAKNGIDASDPQLQQQKEELVKMRLKQLIETRIIFNEARRSIPPEAYNKAMQKFDDEFDLSIAPKMAEERKLPDVAALEAQLRKDGTSLEREKRNFAEMILSNSWVVQNVRVSQDIPHGDLLQFYEEHGAEYDRVGEARWEQITMRFDAFPTRDDAYAALAQIGNQIIDGRPFADAARAASQGSTASQGGAHPLTKQGSLVSKPLDQALFTLPVGDLSPIIEDTTGFHIIRVVERTEAGRVPFTEAQVEIRKKINEKRSEAARKQLVEKVRGRTEIWTIYDKPETESAANPNDNRYR